MGAWTGAWSQGWGEGDRSGHLGKAEVQDLVKDGKVMKPPALAFKAG